MIIVDNVYKKYYSKNRIAYPALNGATLTAKEGELTAILGASGAGKSTLLHILSCIDTYDSGSVKVDDIELNMPEPHYTIRTLNALKEREPDNRFTLVMGADNLADIRRWRDYARILKEFGVAVFPREGHDLTEIKQDLLKEDPAYMIQILDAEMVDISSTQIREAIARGKDISPCLM